MFKSVPELKIDLIYGDFEVSIHQAIKTIEPATLIKKFVFT